MTRSDIEILRFWKTESLAAVFCIGFNLFDGVVKLKGTSLYIPHCFSPWEVEQYGGGTFQLHQQQCKPWLMLLRVSLITLLEEKDKGEEHLFNRPLPSLSMFLSTSLNLTERLKNIPKPALSPLPPVSIFEGLFFAAISQCLNDLFQYDTDSSYYDVLTNISSSSSFSSSSSSSSPTSTNTTSLDELRLIQKQP